MHTAAASLWLIPAALCMLVPGTAASKSKLSIHTSFDNGGPYSWRFLNATHPPVVKLLDDFGPAAAIKATMPNTVIVGRIYLPNQPQDGDPAAAAQSWFNANVGTIRSNPAVTYWEGYNEPSCGSVEEMQWLATFDATRLKLLASVGARGVVGSFSSGTPDVTTPAVVNAFMPAIDAALQYNGILGVHEYNSPDLGNCFDNTTGEGWLIGRYRKLYREFLQPQGRGNISLVISETGIDNSPCTQPASPNFGGWQKYCSWWPQHGYGSNCTATYVSMLAWYDQTLLQQDSYVIGATIFSLEIPGWGDYDISPAVDALIAYANTQH